jgi:non-ribosomal peptide synthetase component F/acyl carrier protein
VSLARRPPSTEAPLSFGQQRLWFLDQLDPGSAAHNIPSAIKLGRADFDALGRALSRVVARHESLRTTFPSQGGRPVQRVSPPFALPLAVEDLRALPEAERRTALQTLATAEAQHRFDLRQGPLLKACVARLRDDEAVLLLTIHHIVADGWSLGVLFRELTLLYDAEVANKPALLPELPVQYADYTLWQMAQLSGETLERELRWWREQLQGAPPVLALPTDRPRPPVRRYRGMGYNVVYPKALASSLHALSRKHGATLFMTLMAAWQALLSRYSGERDLLVGTPVANRSRVELEGLIGFLVNTIVLRTDLSGDPTFATLLGRVRKTALGVFAHQELPFEKLVEELQPARTLSHNPLFQVMMTLQNLPGVAAAAAAGPQVGTGTSKFDLTLAMTEAADGLVASFEYDLDLFDPPTIERMGAHFRRVLEAVAADDGIPLSRLPLAGDEELVAIARFGDGGEGPEPRPAHELIAGEGIAVEDEAGAITYAQLLSRAQRQAVGLRARGIGRGSIVALLLPRTTEMVVTQVAVWMAGAAFLPLDPAWPEERLRWMLDDARPALIIDEKFVPDERDGELLPVGADDLAYVIYTSGSTGRPKGVMVPHRGLAAVAAAAGEHFGAGKRVLQFASPSFDAAVLELLMALGHGGTLCLAPRDQLAPGEPLVETLRRRRIQLALLPPSTLAVLPRAELPELTTLVTGAEAVPPEIVQRWAPGRRLLNAYGPTEMTIWSTVATLAPGQPVTIGAPLRGTEALVLDEHGQAAPLGVAGELYLGGAGVTRGYLGRPGLTAGRFVPHARGRLYRTGDRVRRRADGALEFLGRLDRQVKVRGYRVEPGEIEAVLAEHPGVRECAVVARGGVLHAFVVGELPREFARTRLPEHMAPARYTFLERLPRTGTGKLDRGALPDDGERPALAVRYQAPRTPVESALADIFARVLGLSRVGVDDNFFELGGHSLLATQVISRANEALGLALPLRRLFEAPTVAQLAAASGPPAPATASTAPTRLARVAVKRSTLGEG